MDARDVRCRGIIEGKECGASLQRWYLFCPECGHGVDPNIWKEDPPLVCPKCSWEAPPGSKPKFCPECGTKFETDKPGPPANNPREYVKGSQKVDSLSAKEADVRTPVHTQGYDRSQQPSTLQSGREPVCPSFPNAGSSDAVIRILRENCSKEPTQETVGLLLRIMQSTIAQAHCRVDDSNPEMSAQARTMETRSMTEQKKLQSMKLDMAQQWSFTMADGGTVQSGCKVEDSSRGGNEERKTGQDGNRSNSPSLLDQPSNTGEMTDSTDKNTSIDDAEYSTTLPETASLSSQTDTKQHVGQEQRSEESLQSGREQQMTGQKHSEQSSRSEKGHHTMGQKHSEQSSQSEKGHQTMGEKHSDQSSQSDKGQQSEQIDHDRRVGKRQYSEQSSDYTGQRKMQRGHGEEGERQNPTEQERATKTNAGQVDNNSGLESKTSQKDIQGNQTTVDDHDMIKKGNNMNPRQESTSMNQNREKVTVHFHAVVSCDFKLEANDMVIIRFDNKWQDGGGPECKKHVLTRCRELDDGYWLLGIRLDIPRIQMTAGLEYKYVVIKGGRKGQQIHEKSITKCGQPNARVLRERTNVPLKQRGEIWHQYDGMINKESHTGMLATIGNLIPGIPSRRNKNDGDIAASALLPRWEDICFNMDEATADVITVEEAFWQIDQINQSMKMGQRVLVDHLMSSFIHRLDQMRPTTDEESPNNAIARLSTALFVICLMVQYSVIQWFTKETAVILCEALLLRTPTEDTDYHDTNVVARKFSTCKSGLISALDAFLRMCVNTHCLYHWLLAVPLHHFLSGCTVPYQPIYDQLRSDHRTDGWWGLQYLGRDSKGKSLIDDFKAKSIRGKVDVDFLLSRLKPLFQVDPLLQRTLMAAMEIQHIDAMIASKEIAPEVCMANLIYFLCTDEVTTYTLLQKVAVCKDAILSGIRNLKHESTIERHILKDHTHVVTEISIEFLQLTLNKMTKRDIYHDTLESVMCMVASSIDTLYTIVCQEDSTSPDSKRMLAVLESAFNHATEIVVHWIYKNMHKLDNHYTFVHSDDLQMWSRLIGIVFCNIQYTDRWQQHLLQIVDSRVGQVNKCTMLKQFCTADFTHYHKLIEKLFCDRAFAALDDESSGQFLLDQADTMHGANMCRLLSQKFQKFALSWQATDRSDDPRLIIKHILGWPPFARYLKLKDMHSTTPVLDDQCCHSIDEAVDYLDDTVQHMMTGQISIATLKVILDHTHEMEQIYTIMSSCGRPLGGPATTTADSPIDVLQRVFKWRKSELGQIENRKKDIQNMLGMMGTIKSEQANELHDKLSRINDDMSLVQLCEPRQYTQETATQKDAAPSEVMFLALDDSVEEMLLSMANSKLNVSQIFGVLWIQHCNTAVYHKREQDTGFEQVTLEEVATLVWQPAKQQYDNLCGCIKDGSITLEEVDTCLKAYLDNYSDLKDELQLICTSTDDTAWVERCVYQVEQYHTLDRGCCGAKLIMEAKEAFDLTGNFAVIEALVNAVEDKKRPLSSITDEVVNAKTLLTDVTEEKVDCIRNLTKCKPLITWLQENIDDVKELNVLVELAMNSAAGQGDLEVERVSCLHSAVTGYAPFIYDLKKETNFEDFMKLCEHVWHALKNDKSLPTKLFDTFRHLDWLKNVKESHGSVEVNAISQATAINERGVYCVGKQEGLEPETVDNVVRLLLMPDSEDGEEKHYGFQDLQDLQSKLMLVAGKAEKGNDNVDKFTEVLDAVTRLASVYIKLCASGSILFRFWVSSFFCEPDRKFNASVDFGLSEKMLQGQSQDCPTVAMQIQAVSEFLEECYIDWLKHIEEQRSTFYYLNHYSTQQLVILCKEIVALCSTDEEHIDSCSIDPIVYPMLSAVKPNCTTEDLGRAVKQAFQDLAEREKHANDDGTTTDDAANTVTTEGTDSEETDMKDRLNFVTAMLEADFSKELTNRALRRIPATEIDAGITWCMEHMDDDFSDDDDEEHAEDTSCTLFDVLNVTESFRSITLEQFNKLGADSGSLKSKLTELWKNHLQSAARSVTDHLSLEHLGCILEALADRTDINRPMPHYLVAGVPNLIVCAQADVLRAVLTLYEEGQELPLPETDEVLLCTEHTTAEEVDLLYRRAEGDQHGKIYCLANADMLNYEVSEKAESYLEKHIKGTEDCRLVVICSKEREDKSRLLTALDKHRVNTPLISPVMSTRTYLKKHFHMDSRQQCSLHNAAEVDPEICNVRIVKSDRAGVGKSLRVQRLTEALTMLNGPALYADTAACVTVTLQQKSVDHSDVLGTLVKHIQQPDTVLPRVFHFDIARETQEGVDNLLFNLLVLGSLTDETGYVWRKSSTDLYLIETQPLMWHDSASQRAVTGAHRDETDYVHRILGLLPSLTCRSPQQSLDALTEESPASLFNDWSEHDQLMDDAEFQSDIFQRPYQSLERFSKKKVLHKVKPHVPKGTKADCLRCLLRYCGIPDPSWAELRHFVWFLNVQLCDSEKSNFCCASAQEDLPGFFQFVVHFMIQMSKDFATRSLDVSEETPGLDMHRTQHELAGKREEEPNNDNDQNSEAARVPFQLRRRWETSPHPYLFFNSDRQSMTFLGFCIDYRTGNLLDPERNVILERNMMPRRLYEGLRNNHVKLNENFELLSREMKILKLCNVMGVEDIYDPDEEYELTTDNVKKILAIHMRLRCGIPVVVMGETGCGKTRLIKFMCDLWKPPGADDMRNMVLVKVHGGTTEQDIIKKVDEASKLARENKAKFAHVDTVLFFDEANTTEEIGLIKEIVCDKRMKGRPLPITEGLKIIAACNPYRKHSDQMIQRMDQAGLGYRVQARDTKDKLGYIPMRHLVYRVQALPQSILPLVWDFGQLNFEVESLYIKQMVRRRINDGTLPDTQGLHNVASDILATSQQFMRSQQEECSFVSLRDVKRVLDVMRWFYGQRGLLFRLMDERAKKDIEVNYGNDEQDKPEYKRLNDVTRSLVLALGVCYHARLQNRDDYRKCVTPHFVGSFQLPNGAETIYEEINRCEDVFLDNVRLEPNIARNQALKENVFMMIICIELRIPLFLVGKPGSSKSLARTIVADAMQGKRAHYELFRQFKEAYMISFQCSPLSTPEGIVGTFRQSSQMQKDKDLSEFVAAVVLDEVGLAEDSPSMPLKALHPLLEDGCVGDEDAKPDKKVAFIGISNWALDPAKMNRGILVQRGIPDERELVHTAREITTDKVVQKKISPYVMPLAEAYLELYNSALESREFFGLRDFYSLIKMVSAFSKKSRNEPTWLELEHAIKRNFGGLDSIDPVKKFADKMKNVDKRQPRKVTDPANDAASLIRKSLWRDTCHDRHNESRYLLILTENYAALNILPQLLGSEMTETITIFGSSFPKDQEYTQVCRNINRIKVCMETGKTIVLLNLENLYESLYDALNQYYVYLGGQRFVDLGLGTHRVKCRVHKDFRLIVVAEKQVVYSKFPIPLINRLEKHVLAMTTMLNQQQRDLLHQLKQWANMFADVETRPMATRGWKSLSEGDVFIGYHADTAASLVLQMSRLTESRRTQVNTVDAGDEQEEGRANETQIDGGDEGIEEQAGKILEGSKKLLLQCATPESVIRLRKTKLRQEEQRLIDYYFREQRHGSLEEFLVHELCEEGPQQRVDDLFIQVTTHSKLLSDADIEHLCRALNMRRKGIRPVRLQAFATEQQFSRCIREFLNAESPQERLLLLQCDSGDQNVELIACARHNIENEFNQTTAPGHRRHVVFVIQLPRTAGGCFTGFQGGKWISFHIDDLQPQRDNIPSLLTLMDQSVSSLFGDAVGEEMMQESGIVERFATFGLGAPDTDDQPEVETEADAVESCQPRELSENTAEEEEAPKCAAIPPRCGGIGIQNEPESSHVDSLIRQCVHAAGAILKDSEDLKDRKTERVQLLLRLLKPKKPEVRDMCFIDVLRKRVYLLLRDKEEKAMVEEMAQRWLGNEAASVASVNKAGTFRQSIRQNLEEKVTPLMAAVITLADANAGLDILSDNSTSLSWLRTMYLQMLNDPRVVALTYADLQSTGKSKVELAEMQVLSTGCDGAAFKARVPFSWIIKDKVDMLIHQVQDVPERGDLDALVSNLLRESPLGVVLGKMFDEQQDMTHLVDLYLTDFVQMVHRPRSSNPEMELELVRQAIVSAARDMHARNGVGVDTDTESDGSGATLKLTIERIHLVFNSIQQRLQLFTEAVQLCPDCVVKLDELSKNPDSRFPVDEMTLDGQAMQLLLESMAPTGKCLNDAEQRTAWIKTVQRFQPLIEQFLSVVESKADVYGHVSRELVDRCRRMWTRISVVQLFVNHVCTVATDNESLGVKRCMPLWMLLGEHQDFKKLPALQQVETFLKSTNKTAHKSFFGELENCKQCGSPMITSIRLPCDHIICHNCVKEMNITGLRKCPECKKTWTEEERLRPVEEHREVADRYNTYKEHCNTFFMELVSRLCFEGDTPPEGDVVSRLLEHVTRQTDTDQPLTKEMTVFDSIDPTPVVRSLLLQLLLRSEVDVVKKHLQQYFDQAKQMLQQNTQQTVELCMLFVNCLQDSYHNKASSLVESESELLKMAIDAMTRATKPLTAKGLHVDKFEAIALTQFGLSVAATWMEWLYVQKQRCSNMTEVRKLFDVARTLCDQPHLRWPGLFLMRQLSRRFGLHCLRTVVEVPSLQWVIPQDARDMQSDEMVDRYVVIGETYMHLRKIITWVVVGDKTQLIDDMLTKLPRDNNTERSLLLALYTEITVAGALKDNEHARSTETLTKLGSFCAHSAYIQNKDFADQMLTNQLGMSNVHLNVSADQDPRHLMISSMVTHYKVVMRCCHDNQLLQPLLQLINYPGQMQKSFLPAMPDDSIKNIRMMLLKARDPGWETNPILWECPNGHPYFIDDCGQPQTVGRCNECGATIGGRGYKPATGNKPVTIVDRETGHHLGPAQKRSKQPTPERQLSPAQTALLRLLTHMAMYLGANNNLQQVARLIKPDLDVGDVSEFLWQHICCDMEVLVNAVGKSLDDCILLINLLMCQFIDVPQAAGVRGKEKLLNEGAREQWEVAFADAYVSPMLTGLDNRLQEANRTLVNDERLGNNSLLRELYETKTTPVQIEELEHIENTAAMWGHRTRISIEHLIQELNEHSPDTTALAAGGGRPKQHQILQMFLQEEHHLRALMFLPSIVKLQRILLERYRRKIDKDTANNLKVSDFLHSLPEDARDEHRALIDHFAQAWNIVRERLAGAAFGDVRVPEEMCEEAVTKDTSLAMFLPSLKGVGVCSVALLQYLATIQNNFMEAYSKRTKQSCEEIVCVHEATSAQLISYHPEKDLLPLVISCCQYTLVVGKGSAVTYDFVVLQRQIEERFIRNRPRLDPKISLMVFREDFTNANIFANLGKHVPQESLGRTEQSRIQKELHHLPDVTNSLTNLDIAIGFLVSVGGQPESLLADFMTKTLGMRASIHSQQARQHCCLKHVKSLWLLMSHERAKLLARYGQDPFDDIEENYRETLTDEQVKQLNAMLRHVNVDSLLSAIYECSLLQITVKQDPSTEDYIDNQDHPLGYVVSEYLEATDAPPLLVLTSTRFPKDILVKHCLDTWRQIVLYAAQLQHTGK